MMWNNRYQRNTVCFICGFLLVVSALLAGITAGFAGEDHFEGIGLSVLREDEGVWRVCLSRGLEEITEGRAMAFLCALEVSEGMEIDRVEACGGAEGLHLTVGEAVGYKVSVLLDGYAAEVGEEAENGTILRVYTKGEGGYMGVTAGNCGKMVIYCLQDDGQVMEIPVRIMDEIPLETEKISAEATESESESEPFWEETEEETPPCTNGEAAPETEEEFERAEPNRFMGCRETLPRNSVFSVQFLFYGEGEGTPVVCFGGGGAISVDTSRQEDGWSLCTFRGLDGGKRYEFRVYTEKGEISVIYEGGAFRGFASQSHPKMPPSDDLSSR
jgi:hypothetical protein